jgi:protein TonB
MRADMSTPRGLRLVVAAAVVLLHIALVAALIRAFAPEFTARMTERVFGTVTVTITTPPPPPPVAPSAPQAARAVAGPAGKQAVARPAAAPSPRIVLAPAPAPPIADKGSADTAGARDAGVGAGAEGAGAGAGAATGSGGVGSGGLRKAEKIAGDINSARDYPAATRAVRLGDHVVVALTVGGDGRVKACRVHRASRDPRADAVTCRLAVERFRFRPATNAAGEPVDSIYGWQQRWFGP